MAVSWKYSTLVASVQHPGNGAGALPQTDCTSISPIPVYIPTRRKVDDRRCLYTHKRAAVHTGSEGGGSVYKDSVSQSVGGVYFSPQIHNPVKWVFSAGIHGTVIAQHSQIRRARYGTRALAAVFPGQR